MNTDNKNSRIDSILSGIIWGSGLCFLIPIGIIIIQDDNRSPLNKTFNILFPVWLLAVMLIILYGIYYLDWAGKQFDKSINSWVRFLMIIRNRSTYILITKTTLFMMMVLVILMFIKNLGIIKW